MTFEYIRTKLLKNSWLVVIAIIVANLSLLTNSYSPSYLASITVGLSINNTQYQSLLSSSNNFATNTYGKTLDDLSLYLSSRLAAPDIQNEISENAKLSEKIDTKKPFYEVKNQNAGFVNVSYSAKTKSEGERFVASVNNVFLSKIVTEWNKDRPQLFVIDQVNKNKIDFNNSVIEVKPPIQNTLLPTIAGFLVGILLAILFPTRNFDKKAESISNI
jgi:capsular polysaccharide biosynthesis protein